MSEQEANLARVRDSIDPQSQSISCQMNWSLLESSGGTGGALALLHVNLVAAGTTTRNVACIRRWSTESRICLVSRDTQEIEVTVRKL